jgi:hypothetical protein
MAGDPWLPAEYVKAQEDVIRRNESYLLKGGNKDVFLILNSFLCHYKSILNIGSGGVMPVKVATTTALDVSPVAEEIARKHGYKGKFVVGSCTSLPFKTRSFECGVCAEVIEHLDTREDVLETMDEIDRVCMSWIISTPKVWLPEPDHKRVVQKSDIDFFCRKYGARAGFYKIWWFVWKGEFDPRFPAKAGAVCAMRGLWHG